MNGFGPRLGIMWTVRTIKIAVMRRTIALTSVILCTCFHAGPRRATAEISAGQVNDFEQGTTLGWEHGHQNSDAPRVIGDGGPAGPGDAFLQVSSSGGFGPGSKLAMFNEQETWRGSYLDAGITALEVDLNNLGSEPLTMRFMLEGSGGNVYTDGFALPAGSGWQHASFSLSADDLISGGEIADTLANVRKLWLFHNPNPVHPGPTGTGNLGVDNLEAVGVTIVPPLTGDYNNNGLVEQADLDLVLLHWGDVATGPPAAWVNDLPEGQIDQDELDGVLLNWGNAAEQPNAAAVPEPGAAVLLLIAGVSYLAVRPRYRPCRYRSSRSASLTSTGSI